MGLRIATNVQSLIARRTLGINIESQGRSLEKLASGSRIARAADDAAGLAIAEKMRSQIRSLGQASRNAQDGISIVQTSEGGMTEIANILIRFRELSIQAASDTVTDTERGFIDKEFKQLSDEITRISNSVEWNGKVKLLNGAGGVLEVQVGLGGDLNLDRFRIQAEDTDVRLEKLGLEEVSVATKEAAQENMVKIDGAIRVISENRANLGAMQNRLQSAVNNLSIYRENLSTARSRIFDVDMAEETAELTKNNILAQAGVSVLAQANQNAQMALKLL